MSVPISINENRPSDSRLRERIRKLRVALATDEVENAAAMFPECREA